MSRMQVSVNLSQEVVEGLATIGRPLGLGISGLIDVLIRRGVSSLEQEGHDLGELRMALAVDGPVKGWGPFSPAVLAVVPNESLKRVIREVLAEMLDRGEL